MFWLFALLVNAAPAAVESRAPLDLTVGEQRILRVVGLKKYSLGTPGLLRTTLPPNGDQEAILLKGLKAGASDLWIWKSDGESEVRMVQVRPPSRPGPPPDWQKTLQGLEEVEVLLNKDRAVLQGEVHTPAEARRIERAKAAFPSFILDHTTLQPSLAQQAAARLENWLKQQGLEAHLKLVPVLDRHRLTGHLPEARDRASIERNVRARYPLIELQLDSLPDDSPTLFFKVQLLEMKKSRLQRLGVSWPEQISTSFLAGLSGIRSLTELDLTLNALELEGSLRVLSRPEIAVRTPGEAELFAGGELPMRTRSRFGEQIQWKKFGLTLQLKAAARAGPRVRLEITTEVSHLDESIAVGEVPGLQTNRLKTQVDAEIERPLMLSGLLQEGIRAQAKGLPALRKIPVLGSLFGSEDFMNDRSELVAILIPYDRPPPPPQLPELTPPAPTPIEPARHEPRARPFGLILR